LRQASGEVGLHCALFLLPDSPAARAFPLPRRGSIKLPAKNYPHAGDSRPTACFYDPVKGETFDRIREHLYRLAGQVSVTSSTVRGAGGPFRREYAGFWPIAHSGERQVSRTFFKTRRRQNGGSSFLLGAVSSAGAGRLASARCKVCRHGNCWNLSVIDGNGARELSRGT